MGCSRPEEAATQARGCIALKPPQPLTLKKMWRCRFFRLDRQMVCCWPDGWMDGRTSKRWTNGKKDGYHQDTVGPILTQKFYWKKILIVYCSRLKLCFQFYRILHQRKKDYGWIHLPLNKTLTDDTSVKWSTIMKTFLFFIRFWWNLVKL